MAQHDRVTRQVRPDPFLKSPVSDEERNAIASFDRARARVLEGTTFNDFSMPWHAYLSLLANNPDRAAELKAATLVRVFLPPAQPRNADLAPVFVRDVDGMYDAPVFVHWRGAWHFVGNSGYVSLWRERLDPYLKAKLEALRNPGR